MRLEQMGMQAPVRRKQVRLLWLCLSLLLSHTYVNAERQHGVYVDRNHGPGRAFLVRFLRLRTGQAGRNSASR